MSDFFSKTLYKLKLLFTHPKKFFQILYSITKANFFPDPLPEQGQRFTTNLESLTLQKYAAQARLGVVEIGVLDGGTTREMAVFCKVPIYGIDPLIPDSMNKRLVGDEAKIRKNMEFYQQFHFFKDYSYSLQKNWLYEFDFIFIDGDHRYEAVKQDFEQWLPLLEVGGVIAFHDSAPMTSIPGAFEGWPGPVKLVAKIKRRPDLEYLETVDSLSFFRKK